MGGVVPGVLFLVFRRCVQGFASTVCRAVVMVKVVMVGVLVTL